MSLNDAKIEAASLADQSVKSVQRLCDKEMTESSQLAEAKFLRRLGSALTGCALEIQARLLGKEEPKVGD